MKLITISGPPASGKTAVILHLIRELKEKALKTGVLKFDCIATEDHKTYVANGVPCATGLSGSMCPDHYFVSNIDDCVEWGIREGFDLLISESAGLCSRCAPHIQNCLAVCVIDNLMGLDTPKKLGPMLKMADIVVVTKGDIVSQAEREIFSLKIRQANPECAILYVNGITGQGARHLAARILVAPDTENLKQERLRVTMPSALCSYCLGERRIGQEKQKGNVKKMELKWSEGNG